MGFFTFHSISEEGQVLVGRAEGAVAGFTKLIEFQISGGKYGCILWIAVHPNFRRKGVATALTFEGLTHLKKEGASAVFASTQRRNSAALAVLGRNGFQRIGFMGLRRLFGWRVLQFYSDIWLAPGEVVLINC
jgi:ribosomal protein S18 acetylase RimI-like enzyme